jgi:hypothetical protein
MTVNNSKALKNNEEFEVTNFNDKTISIKNERLETSITFKEFKQKVIYQFNQL